MASPASLHTQLRDAFTAEQLRMLRTEAHQRQVLWGILALLQGEMLSALKRVDPTEPLTLSGRQRRVVQLIEEELGPLVQTRYAQLATETMTFLLALAHYAATAARHLVRTVTAADTLPTPVVRATLRDQVRETLFPSGTRATDLSTTAAEWWDRQRASLLQRLRDQALVSVSLEESLAQVLTRVRGTAALGHTDGVMAQAKKEAARLLRTAVTHAIATAREAVAEANSASRMVLEHSSILDARTSDICLGRDGLQFTAAAPHEPLGHHIPYLLGPPYHPNCRSMMILVMRDGAPSASGSVEGFLERQSVTMQRAILGPGRWDLWQKGILKTPRDLLDTATGRPLTLDELRG